MEKTGTKNFWSILFILALMTGVVWFAGMIGSVIGNFITAGAIAYILNPAVVSLTKIRIPRPLAILLMFLIFIGGMVLAVALIVPPAIREFKDLIANVPQYFEALKGLWERAMGLAQSNQLPVNLEKFPEQIAQNFQSVASTAGSKVFSGISAFAGKLPTLIIVPILVYYFLSDGSKVKKSLIKLLPPLHRNDTSEVLEKMNTALGGFIRGQLKLCLAMGLLTWFALAVVVKMKYAVIFALIAGVTEFIPYLGPVLALVGPLIYATTVSPAMIGKLLGAFVVIQLLEGNVLAPKIVGNDVDMHPAVIMFVMMAGGELGGIVGMITAIPVAVIVKVLFEHYYVNKYLASLETAEKET